MKIKHLLVGILIGFLFTVVGTLFKIQHWQFAGEIFALGSLIKVIFIVLLIWKILISEKSKDFLNW
jgi:hypothetical protein